jgi:hypothetical protein
VASAAKPLLCECGLALRMSVAYAGNPASMMDLLRGAVTILRAAENGEQHGEQDRNVICMLRNRGALYWSALPDCHACRMPTKIEA